MQIYNNDVILRPGMVLVLELRFNLVSHAPVKYVPVKQKTGRFNRINSAPHWHAPVKQKKKGWFNGVKIARGRRRLTQII